MRLGAGPYKGFPFRVDRQPVTGLLFDEFDRASWEEIFIAGPSQSSKTLCGFVIPTLRDTVELRLDALVGTPEADMFTDKWDKDFLPVFQSSPQLSWLIPEKGPGSKGGRVKDRITLGNGVDIKVMTTGGADTAKAGFSSPRLRLTEAAGWSKQKDSSVEGGSFRQVKARMRAFKRSDSRRLLTVEGTMTIDEELPMLARGQDDDERLISTRSRILSPCPHCEAWILPERTHLAGWQDCENEEEVKNCATWICPSCASTINDDERATSMRDCRLVHWGQTLTDKGEIEGDPPPTSTLWFHWTSWHNLLLDAADIALDEWQADQIDEGTQDREAADRALCQFTHGVTFKPPEEVGEPLNPKLLRRRTTDYPRNLIPEDTLHLTVGVDLGAWTGWWFAIAWRACGVLQVPAYGAFDVKRNKSDELSTRIKASCIELAGVLNKGFPVDRKLENMKPDVVLFDGGWMPDDVAKAVRELGRGWKNNYRMIRGRGESVRGGSYNHPLKATTKKPKVGTQWYGEPNHKRRIPEYTFNADYWKVYVEERLRVEQGKKGSLVLFRPEDKGTHSRVTNHLCNEQFRKELVKGKGYVGKWIKTGDNHLLDAAAMACVAGDMVGYNLTDIVVEKESESPNSNWCKELLT